MCNNMMIYADSAQICKRAVSQKFLSFYDFYVGEQWPQIMCGCIAVCGSTLVFFMPRMILCSKRSVGRHEICFYFISTVRATTEPKFKICNLKNIPSHGQPKGAPPCDWTMKVPDRINELVFETPFFFLTCSSWMWMFQFDEIVSFRGGHLRQLVVHVGLFQKTTTCILMYFDCFDDYNNYMMVTIIWRKNNGLPDLTARFCTCETQSRSIDIGVAVAA